MYQDEVSPKNGAFDSQYLAADLLEVCRIYADFFNNLSDDEWERPIKGKGDAWNLEETVAHLCALNGAGLNSLKARLQEETYIFVGLDSRYQFNAYNRLGINDNLNLSREDLCAKLLDILQESAAIARSLQPGEVDMAGGCGGQ